ncbi:MAG: zinc-binding dehydrogenase [Anaeromyxobacteraceae bacterium]
MRAAVLAGPRRFELHEVPLPEPGPGEVRVRLEGSGVCGSNLVPWQGRPWFRYPFRAGAPGHEGWGRVEALGAGVAGLREGDRVALLSGHAFAEADVAPADRLIPLPEAVRGPFPGEALGCGVNVFQRCRVRPGEVVAVVGAGFIGLTVCRLAAAAGAIVIAVSRRGAALAHARGQGASAAVPSVDPAEAIASVEAIAGPRGCDVVVEAVGDQRSLDLATALVREGGRLVIAGFHQDGTRTVDLGAWNWRGLEIVNAHERDPAVQRAGLAAAVEAVAAGRLDPSRLYTAFTLDRLDEAFLAMEERPGTFVKAVVTP